MLLILKITKRSVVIVSVHKGDMVLDNGIFSYQVAFYIGASELCFIMKRSQHFVYWNEKVILHSPLDFVVELYFS